MQMSNACFCNVKLIADVCVLQKKNECHGLTCILLKVVAEVGDTKL